MPVPTTDGPDTAPEPVHEVALSSPGSLALVIPVYNEAAMLPELVSAIEAYRRARPWLGQVILVDDGSTDGSADLARNLCEGRQGYEVVVFSRNFGHQVAVTAGLDLADADAVVVMDADLQDPLDVIDTMVERWREGYDVVYGIREAREGETRFKRWTATLFYRLFRWTTDLELPVDAGDFRLVTRRVISAYRRIAEQQPFVRGLISWLGFNQIGIPYVRARRAAGSTKYTVRRMMRLAMNSITSFSDKPLRVAVRLGLLISAGSLVGGAVWAILAKVVLRTAITGWASLLVVIVFFGGVQLFFLGLVGLYLARVYEEVKGRPRYVLRGIWRSDESEPDRASRNPDDASRTST